MTTIEFVAKNLHKARIKLEKAKQKPNVSHDETAILEEQIAHYEDICKLLTADVAEVVRCKDCKHYRPQVKSSQWENKTNYCCRTAVIKVKPNDFCSFGAKMDGKGEGE